MELIKLSKTPCGGCVLLGNHLDELGVTYTEIDIFDDETIQERFGLSSEVFRDEYNITSAPVLLLIDDEGQVVDRVNGFNPPLVLALIEKM